MLQEGACRWHRMVLRCCVRRKQARCVRSVWSANRILMDAQRRRVSPAQRLWQPNGLLCGIVGYQAFPQNQAYSEKFSGFWIPQ